MKMQQQNKPDIKIYICETEEEATQRAFELLKEEIKKKPDIVLGGATGNSPIGLYKELIKSVAKGDLDLSEAKIIFLDEYFGRKNYYNYAISRLHYGLFVEKIENEKTIQNLLPENRKDKTFKKENIYVPEGYFYNNKRLIDGLGELEKILIENHDDFEKIGPEIRIKKTAKNPILKEIKEFYEYYENLIDKLRIDYQILGIGPEGHIGFNEMGTEKDNLTHLTELAPSTIKANIDDFLDGFPTKYAITQGIATIAKARNRIMLAFGEKKQDAVYNMLLGDICSNNPASYLREMAGTTHVFLDKESAARLDLEELEARGYTIGDKEKWKRPLK